PDIGEAFDSSQTTLNLIAVGYSLGLAASVLWFGALGARYGPKLIFRRARRPRRRQADDRARDGAVDPGFPSRRVRALRRGALRRARRGRVVRRDGLSDHARADHGALVRRGPGEGNRALVAGRRGERPDL